METTKVESTWEINTHTHTHTHTLSETLMLEQEADA